MKKLRKSRHRLRPGPVLVFISSPEATSFATLAYAAGAVASTAEDLRRWIVTLLASGLLTPSGDMMRYLEATIRMSPASSVWTGFAGVSGQG